MNGSDKTGKVHILPWGGDNGATSPPNPPDPPDMESRVTALETKWDAVIPTLATKSDLAEVRTDFAGLRADFAGLRAEFAELRGDLRTEMHKMDASLKTWMLGTVLTIIGTILALGAYLTNSLKPTPQPPVQSQQPTIIVVPAAAAPATVVPPAAATPPAAPASR